MELTTILALLVTPLVAQFVYRYWTNPLCKIPAAHPLAHFTSLWIYYVRWRAVENTTLKRAHAQLGPIVCLGPNEVSVNCVKGGIRDVYAGGFEKSNASGTFNWYAFFSNYGSVDNMFSTGHNKPHSARKRMLSNIYSKSVVTASPALLAQVSSIIYDRFLPRLESTFSDEDTGVLNIYALLSAVTMDIVTGYIFGLKSGSNLISNPEQLSWFLGLYNSRRSFNFWPQELPALTNFVQKWIGYRLVPQWVDEANGKIEDWTKAMCQSAAAVTADGVANVADTPVVYGQLSVVLAKEVKKAGGEALELDSHVASEVLDHLAAGFDTSGITLTYVIHELCRHPEVQVRLQRELRTLSPRIVHSSSPSLPDGKAVDALPFLHAVIWETLRLHPAIPGPQPRVSPPQGCRLGSEDNTYYVPGGVRVSASAGLLHLNEDVYLYAGEWKPERWLDLENLDEEKRRDMENRWFWAFGSGGRMCVGSHLAVYQMKYILAALYSNYTTAIVDDNGIEQSDAYTAPPQSDKLLIRLQKLNSYPSDM
ncbi:cytochrome P450 monooxygenase-like protein [Bimuria novae-zelandiae CBS 107.79]|uniref:Cytochrome P450 monooxygenase-like protein n=1 Tax=Bimuria novae-zelandiae CBS 107.79 TaxID=1447943 RepID=A0A6A5V060_9PLEO|nr:cytochrome P450 monooxygenase-like protein [Bimuria novae-zelandiae CBS 107.79]